MSFSLQLLGTKIMYFTVHCLYFETLEVRFKFSMTFWKLSLAFNLEYLSTFFINFQNQWQFQNPHYEQIPKLPLIFEIDEEMTKIFKVKGKAPFPKKQ